MPPGCVISETRNPLASDDVTVLDLTRAALARIVHAVWVWAARRSTEVPAQQGKLGLATVQVVPAERHSVGEAYFVVDRLVLVMVSAWWPTRVVSRPGCWPTGQV